MIRGKYLFLAAFGIGIFACQSFASELWSSNFIPLSGNFGGTQYQTGNTLVYDATIQGWTVSGFHAAHAVELSPTDWSLMVYAGGGQGANNYTLNTGFGANNANTTYWVGFQIAPTVYADAAQQTTASNLLQISVLNPANQVVATSLVSAGAWDGTETFHAASFSYTGNGTGNVRLQITSGDAGANAFDGAINEISFWDSQPVSSSTPEPATFLLVGLSVLAAASRLRPTKRFL